MDEEIKDSTILKIALLVSFSGILILFIMMYFSVLPEKTIKEINDTDIGKRIKITGVLDKISHSKDNKTSFISIYQLCSIDAVSFSNLDLKNGSHISVEGKVQQYDGGLSIIADKVQVIDSDTSIRS